MPIYISRGRFTSDAIKGMLAKPENREEAVATECFPQITESRRGHVHHFFAAAPEEQSSDNHRYAWNSKRPTRSPLLIRKKPWTKNRRNE